MDGTWLFNFVKRCFLLSLQGGNRAVILKKKLGARRFTCHKDVEKKWKRKSELVLWTSVCCERNKQVELEIFNCDQNSNYGTVETCLDNCYVWNIDTEVCNVRNNRQEKKRCLLCHGFVYLLWDSRRIFSKQFERLLKGKKTGHYHLCHRLPRSKTK